MTNIQTLTDSLAKKRAELERLQADLEAAREKQFTELPAQVGFQTIDELIRSLVKYASPRLKGVLNPVLAGRSPASATAKPARGTKKRTRATITDEVRAQIVEAAKKGEMTGAEIAKKFGVSVPSVANIKKAAGLTKKRGKK
jgi:hypothetical protein